MTLAKHGTIPEDADDQNYLLLPLFVLPSIIIPLTYRNPIDIRFPDMFRKYYIFTSTTKHDDAPWLVIFPTQNSILVVEIDTMPAVIRSVSYSV